MVPFGICKIVPPAEWRPACQVDLANSKRFPTKKQQINTLQQGQGFDDGKDYTIAEYKAMADAFFERWCEMHHMDNVSTGKAVGHAALERDYWNMVETNNRAAVVEYGNDIDTSLYQSGFPSRSAVLGEANTVHSTTKVVPITWKSVQTDRRNIRTFVKSFYTTTGWNLNNIPTSRGSLLQYLHTPITGVNVPWLYVGMLFASFCWHNEDNYFYSISYNHFGATKQWYSVPGDRAADFEKV